MDPDLLLEALSALTSTTVKALTNRGGDTTSTDLKQMLNAETESSSAGDNLWFIRPQLLLVRLRGLSVKDKDEVHHGLNTLTLLKIDNFLDVSLKASSSYTVGSSPCFLALEDSLKKPLMAAHQDMEDVFSVDLEEFHDPGYDYDFRKLKDDSACSRGGEPYRRPRGYYRFALKVKDKYPDGNVWLGSGGWRSSSDPGEWPVSFHGTSYKNAKKIIRTHFEAGIRELYGRGIYSTPDIKIAEGYASTFTSMKNGKKYRVIMQNRINPDPKKRKIIEEENYWLIKVPEGTTAEEEKKIVEGSIRPYGILIKEV